MIIIIDLISSHSVTANKLMITDTITVREREPILFFITLYLILQTRYELLRRNCQSIYIESSYPTAVALIVINFLRVLHLFYLVVDKSATLHVSREILSLRISNENVMHHASIHEMHFCVCGIFESIG
jgi:hypothetical protein